MVVGHDYVEAGGLGMGDLWHVADAAIDGDQQPHPLGDQPVDRVSVQAVTFV
jgi:hypothetical protein